MRNTDFLIGAGLIVFCLLFFSFGAKRLGYSIPDEKRYIQSVKEMVDGGDWVTPHYHGKKRFEKPPLFYWLGAISSKVFGLNIYTSRFPSILFGAFSVFLVYLLTLELFNRGAAITSALFLATSGMFYMYSRFATPDILLLFFITLSVYFFIRACKKKDNPQLYSFLFFFCMALATLTKGPIGAILPILMAIMFISTNKDQVNSIKKMNIGVGSLIFLLIALPWFLLMAKTHSSEYLDHIWKVETVGRIGTNKNFFSLIKSFLSYIPVVILGNLPIALFLVPSIIGTLKSSEFKKKKEILFLLSWVILVMVFFSIIGTKKGHYMLVASPAIAMIIGSACFYAKENIYKRFSFKIPFFIIISVYVIGLLSLTTLISYMQGRISLLNYFAMVAPLILIWGWIKKKKFPVIFVLSNILVLLFVAGVAIPSLDNKPLMKFATTIESQFKEGDIVGVGSHVISHNRLSRYLDKKVKKVNVDLANRDSHVQRNKNLILGFLSKKERVFCVVTNENYVNYVPAPLKRNLYVLDYEYKWKKTNKINFDTKLIWYFLSGKKDLFMGEVREKILLVSNKS